MTHLDGNLATESPESGISSGFQWRIVALLATACRDLSPTVIIASVFINFLSLMMPLAVMQVYDRIVPRQATETLGALMMVVICVVLVEAVLQISRGHVLRWSATQLAWQAYRELLTRLLLSPQAALSQESAGRTLDRAQALTAYAEWHGSPSRLVLIDVPFVLLFLGLAAIIGGWLVMIPIILFTVFGIAAIRHGEKLRRASEDRSIEEMKVRDFLIETLTGLTTVKAGGMEPQMLQRFDRLLESQAACSSRLVRLGEEAQAYAGLLSHLIQIVSVTLGAILVIGDAMSVGTLACCVMLAGRAVQPLLRCYSVWNELQGVVMGLEKAAPLLNLPQVSPASKVERVNGPLSINLDNVSLRDKRGGVILDCATIDIPAGAIVALMGRDGSGKSTIVDFLCGANAPESGRLSLSGYAFESDAAILKPAISVVRPGNATIRGTILDNITMYRQGDETEIAIEAARLIDLDREILHLPLGYETPLAEGVGAELPPGIVQRINIARAIARRPGLLIIDEANTALDLKADQKLAHGLQRLRGHATIFIVTNRPSLAKIADRVLVLEDGGLIAGEERLGKRSAAA
jgi:ATP-binding cassette subfamily C protein LapB